MPEPTGYPDTDIPQQALGLRVQLYGMDKHFKLFTNRQLVTMLTFTDLVGEARKRLIDDCIGVEWLPKDSRSLNDEGGGCVAYADAVATYLALAVDKIAIYGCSLVPWYAKEDRPSMLFGRQAISMVWDFAEVNPFSDIGGSASKAFKIVSDCLAPVNSKVVGCVSQCDAAAHLPVTKAMIATGPTVL